MHISLLLLLLLVAVYCCLVTVLAAAVAAAAAKPFDHLMIFSDDFPAFPLLPPLFSLLSRSSTHALRHRLADWLTEFPVQLFSVDNLTHIITSKLSVVVNVVNVVNVLVVVAVSTVWHFDRLWTTGSQLNLCWPWLSWQLALISKSN